MEKEDYHGKLKSKIDTYVHLVYRISRGFPKEELYGITSQLRRASLSIALNYVEGYARMRNKVHKNFLEISYGSLKESQYLLQFSLDEKYLSAAQFKEATDLANEVGAMLWGIMRRL